MNYSSRYTVGSRAACFVFIVPGPASEREREKGRKGFYCQCLNKNILKPYWRVADKTLLSARWLPGTVCHPRSPSARSCLLHSHHVPGLLAKSS